MVEHEGFEVTTYRIDGEYEDARHPKNVQFTASLLEDLKRRDFTINAMAYNDKNGLVDAFDGVGDLERGVIRCVGCATERFSEDALRMLRAVRFAAQLGFAIEEETKGDGKTCTEYCKSQCGTGTDRTGKINYFCASGRDQNSMGDRSYSSISAGV